MNTITWTKKALRQHRKLDRNVRGQIESMIEELAAFTGSNHPKAKQLTDHQYGYRLRVQRYRVLFDYHQSKVIIQEVLIRNERTY